MALLGFSLPFLGGCTFAARHVTMTTVHVEVDIYSGRENPGWDLGEAEATDFLTRLALLSPDIAGLPSVPDGLGYRGLHVVVHSGGSPQRLAIAGGIVIVEADIAADRRRLRDPDRTLERWLLGTGKEYLGTDLLHDLLTLCQGNRPATN
jgi:hypothetical protein